MPYFVCADGKAFSNGHSTYIGSALKNISRFHEGQIVSVVAGTKDPDYGFPIGGWSGVIEDVDLSGDGTGRWIYGIRWSNSTLKAMKRALRKKCEKNGFDETRMFLDEDELVAK